MLYFDFVICKNLPEKTNLAILRLDSLVLCVDDLNELCILVFERLLFPLFGSICSGFDILVVMMTKHARYYGCRRVLL